MKEGDANGLNLRAQKRTKQLENFLCFIFLFLVLDQDLDTDTSIMGSKSLIINALEACNIPVKIKKYLSCLSYVFIVFVKKQNFSLQVYAKCCALWGYWGSTSRYLSKEVNIGTSTPGVARRTLSSVASEPAASSRSLK